MFDKILIANRGEIACRVMRTAKQMGIRTVAVYSDADKNAMHVAMADEAYHIGAAPARESYLKSDVILEVAKQCGAQAVHPGYGFLSENEGFAKACAENEITFIGPPPSAIAAMGSKSAAKQIMEEAGVPLVPGYHGDDQSEELIRAESNKIGYPVLLKATAGGGGKGMRIVWSEDEFSAEFAAAKREALSSFNDDKMLVEKYLTKPRHIEIQVFADTLDNAVFLFERDCSIQRRHQKILEEAPAPDMPEELRQKMGESAIAAARAIGYVGAGTVEFLLDEDGSFYFMEMNTRLQVEHPVTEMITGQDLVKWQLLVASGQVLPKTQEQLQITGHAIEARVYAEDPNNNFLPATGRLKHLRTPKENAHVRIDTGVREGDSVSVHYDPMIAKLIVWDTDRAGALRQLRAALSDYQVVGVTTNIDFLAATSAHPAYVANDVDTGFIPRHEADLFPDAEPVSDKVLALACLDELLRRNEEISSRAQSSYDPYSPWNSATGWRMNGGNHHLVCFLDGDTQLEVRADFQQDGYLLSLPSGSSLLVRGEFDGEGNLLADLGGDRTKATMVRHGNELTIMSYGTSHRLVVHDPALFDEDDHEQSGNLTAPMTGKIVSVLTEEGTKVKQGDALIVMEAMKMEYTIQAPHNGVVTQVNFAAGELVDDGVALLVLEEEEAS